MTTDEANAYGHIQALAANGYFSGVCAPRISDVLPLSTDEDDPGPAQQAVVLTLPRHPTPPLSMNEAIGMHWGAYAKRMDPWRDEIAWIAKPYRRVVQAMPKPVTIQVTIYVKPRSTYDPSNLLPCMKSLVDGLKSAGLFPNDGPTYVTTLEPVLIKDKDSREVTLTITPASHARDT